MCHVKHSHWYRISKNSYGCVLKKITVPLQLCAQTPLGPFCIARRGVCAHMCVRSMNAQPELFYYSLEPDVPLIGGWGRSDEEERQQNNEVRCIRVAPFYCRFTHSTVQFATLWVSSVSVTLLRLLSPSQICLSSLHNLHLLPLSVCLCLFLPPLSLLLMWRQMLRAPRRRVSLI